MILNHLISIGFMLFMDVALSNSTSNETSSEPSYSSMVNSSSMSTISSDISSSESDSPSLTIFTSSSSMNSLNSSSTEDEISPSMSASPLMTTSETSNMSTTEEYRPTSESSPMTISEESSSLATTSSPLTSSLSNSSMPTLIIENEIILIVASSLGGFVAILIITALLITFILCALKKRQGRKGSYLTKLSMTEYKTYQSHDKLANTKAKNALPISKDDFFNHFKQMRHEDNCGFETEFDTIINDPKGVVTAAETHSHKNRYKNILTFDHARVVLSVPDENGSDYINASYIEGYNRQNEYIATQGPTKNTISDFWQMIWDCKAIVIVMLTKPEEKGRSKCEVYWKKDLPIGFKVGRNITVTLNKSMGYADYEVNEITITNSTSPGNKPHTLHHFFYTGWPDHGVPQHTSSMVKLSQHVRRMLKDNTAPILVHCSAGVGRSGTFIAIDVMLQRLKERTDLNIYEFVTNMRSRRMFMVQNLEQYVFIHEAISDYLHSGDTAIESYNLRPRIYEMEKPTAESKKSGFEKQYELLEEMSKKPCSEDRTHSRKYQVMKKNRYKDKYPYSLKYVKIFGRIDNDYFNGTYINSYSANEAFIAAQSPMSNTRKDFWEVVWDVKPHVVVLLCDFIESNHDTCSIFWPITIEKQKFEEYSFLNVETTGLQECNGYKEYSLRISDRKMSTSLPWDLTLLHMNDWKLNEIPPIPPLLEMIGKVQKIQKGQDRPAIIMCNDGMGRTGVFITAICETERVKVEGEVDIFQTVKAIRIQRPKMVTNTVQYKLCHEILMAYLDSFDAYANFKAV